MLRIASFLLILLGCNFLQAAPELTSTPLSPTLTDTPTNTPALTITPLSSTATPSPTPTVEMILVPAGEYKMGQGGGFNEAEKPVHIVYLDAFYIDQYEVTNALYKTCVDAGFCQSPLDFSSAAHSRYYGNPEFDNYPVIYIDWDMARTYCEWRGVRLPTEAEWEKAARSTDQRTYPWGEGIDLTYANYDGLNQRGVGDTTAVGNYEKGRSEYGVYDMAGNVWEWVADWFDKEYYGTLGADTVNPQGPASGENHVMRGGSWFSTDYYVRSAFRGKFPASTGNTVGFRCADSPDTSTQTYTPTPQPIATLTPEIQVSVAPVIESVNLRSETSAGSLTVLQDISFHDPQGDAYKVHYEIVSATVTDLQVDDGMIDIPAQQQKTGVMITGRWNCGGGKYDVTLRVTVLDRNGNRSNVIEYTLNCK